MTDRNEELTNAWNQFLSKRLTALRSHFKDDAYKEGIEKYLKMVVQNQIDYLIHGSESRDKDQLIRGRISAFREMLDLPATIERQIEIQNKVKESQDKRGQAGY